MFREKVDIKVRLKNQSFICWPGVQQMPVNYVQQYQDGGYDRFVQFFNSKG